MFHKFHYLGSLTRLCLAFFFCFAIGCDDIATKVKQGAVIADKTELKSRAETEAKILLPMVRKLIVAVAKKDSDGILRQIHPNKGAFIDVKSPLSYEKIEKDFQKQNGILIPPLWNTAELRRRSGDPDLLSFRDYFRNAKEIRVSFYFYSASECEVRLAFADRPSNGVMGNPIYHKIDGRWYLKRIF